MYISWLTFNLVPLEQKMVPMGEGMKLGGQAFTVAVTVCIHPKGGIYQDLVGNFQGDNGFLTVWNKILTGFFFFIKDFFFELKISVWVKFAQGEDEEEAHLSLAVLMITPRDVQGQEIKQQKQVTIWKVLKQPDCFFFTYCSQCGLAPLWSLRYPQRCQEKQTQPSRRRKGQEDKPGRGPRIYQQLTKGCLLTPWWKQLCEEGITPGNSSLLSGSLSLFHTAAHVVI